MEPKPDVDQLKLLLQTGLDGPPPEFVAAPEGFPRQGKEAWIPPLPELLQQSVPELEIKALTGRGGMGAVYQCYDPLLGRTVALKIPSPALGEDAEIRQRFRREGMAMANLRHPHILTVFRSIQAGNFPALVMEFVEGCDLARLIRQSTAARRAGTLDPLPLCEGLRIFSEICAAMDHAHRAGVLHRDLKPSNILLDESRAARVGDFGLARPVTADEAYVSRTDRVAGSLAYMAPEQLRGQPVDHRTDIYALGIMLHEIVTGQIPSSRPLQELRPGAPKVLGGIIAKATAPNPEERWKNAAELESKIAGVLMDLKKPAWQRWTQRVLAAGGAAAVLTAVAASMMDDGALNDGAQRDEVTAPSVLADPPGTRVNHEGHKLVPVPGLPHLFAGMHEVRVSDFAAFIRATGYQPASRIKPEKQEFVFTSGYYQWNSPGRDQQPDHPVTCISWRDADAYCQWLTETARARKEITAPAEYRLLTDAEWSALAGVDNHGKDWLWERPQELPVFTWGNKLAKPPGWENHADTDSRASPDNKRDVWKTAAPVGALRRSAHGFHDLGGNVREWVLDAYEFSDSRHGVRSTGFRGRPNITQYSLARRSDCWRDGGNDTLGMRIVLDLKQREATPLALRLESAILACHGGSLPPLGQRVRAWLTGEGVTLDLSASRQSVALEPFSGIPVRELIAGPSMAGADFSPVVSPELKRACFTGAWPHPDSLRQMALEYLTVDGGHEASTAGSEQLTGVNVSRLRGLCVRDAPAFRDLSPFRNAGMLRIIRLMRTGVSDLQPLSALTLDELDVAGSPVTMQALSAVPRAARIPYEHAHLAPVWDQVHRGDLQQAAATLGALTAAAGSCRWMTEPEWRQRLAAVRAILAHPAIQQGAQTLPEANPASIKAGGWQFGGSRYAVAPGGYPVSEAWWLATVLSGHPVVIGSAEEQKWIRSRLITSNPSMEPQCHIGGIRRADGQWQWCTGEPWKFSLWLDQNVPRFSDRAYFAGSHWSTQWNCPPREKWRQDSLRDNSHYPLIIEWDLEPKPVTAFVQSMSQTWTGPDGEPLLLHSDGRVDSQSIAFAWWFPTDPGAGTALLWRNSGFQQSRLTLHKDKQQLICETGNSPPQTYRITTIP